MSPQLEIRNKNNVVILTGAGRLVLGAGTSVIRETLGELIRAVRLQIVLNLQAVTFMDTAVVGELVAAARRIVPLGGRISLVNSKRVQDILLITRLHMFFEIFDNEAAAVRSFSKEWPDTVCWDKILPWLRAQSHQRQSAAIPTRGHGLSLADTSSLCHRPVVVISETGESK
jgi:anti-anti-sigma factor